MTKWFVFLSHNPWGREIASGGKTKVLVGEYDLRKIDNA